MAAPNKVGQGIWNGYAPEEGPKLLDWEIDFSSVGTQTMDLFVQNTQGQFTFAQTLWVDNTRNPYPVIFVVQVTQQRIVVAGGAGQIMPLFSPDQTQITAVTTASAGAFCQVMVLNVPLPAMAWSGIAPGAQAPLSAGTDKSGNIAVGGAAQTMVAANANRMSLTGQNISVGDLWFNETGGVAAINGVGSFKVATLQTFAIATSRVISVFGATTGQQWTATET